MTDTRTHTKKEYRRIALFALLGILLAALLMPCATEFSFAAVTAADFTDVDELYWGYSYVDDTARAGIIEGYLAEDGTRTFRPENEVTKQEAITMVVNTATRAGIGYTNGDYTEKWTSRMEEAGVDPWAYPYVSYGLEKGFLEEEELPDFMTSPGVSQKATREEVFSWVARALWSKYKGLEDKLFVLTYTDADQIDEARAPYIGLLSNLGILVGNDNGNGTFSLFPKSPIRRVEFAVICSKVYALARASGKTSTGTLLTGSEGPAYGSVSGVITQITASSIDSDAFTVSLVDENGIPFAITANSTPCYINGVRNKQIPDIAKGTHVVVAHDEIGTLQIDTKMNTLTVQIMSAKKEDDLGNQRIGIRLSDDTATIYYYLNSKQDGVSVTGRVAANKKATFLADGVNIIEISIK